MYCTHEVICGLNNSLIEAFSNKPTWKDKTNVLRSSMSDARGGKKYIFNG